MVNAKKEQPWWMIRIVYQNNMFKSILANGMQSFSINKDQLLAKVKKKPNYQF